MEIITATAIQLLIRMFKHHTVRQHGLCLPGTQETSLALHLGGPSSHSVAPYEKLPVNEDLHKFMLYMGLRHTTATPLTATVLNYAETFSSSSRESHARKQNAEEMATQQET